MMPFRYVRPSNLQDALAEMASPGAHAFAGGTTLFDLAKLGVVSPAKLVDVGRLPDLSAIDETADGGLKIGALCKMSDVSDDLRVKCRYPAVREALWRAASAQIRNMATIGGNLLQRSRCSYFRRTDFACNRRDPGSGCDAKDAHSRNAAILGVSDACIAVYPGDLAVALSIFDAGINIVGPHGARTVPIDGFYRLPGRTPDKEFAMTRGELIVGVTLPPAPWAALSSYKKVRDRASYAFALSSAAVGIALEGGRIRETRIALGGIATIPWRATTAEAALRGFYPSEDSVRNAATKQFAGMEAPDDVRFKIPLAIETIVEAFRLALIPPADRPIN